MDRLLQPGAARRAAPDHTIDGKGSRNQPDAQQRLQRVVDGEQDQQHRHHPEEHDRRPGVAGDVERRIAPAEHETDATVAAMNTTVMKTK